MKYKLNLLERFALLDILPKEGNFATLKLIRKLREQITLSEDEFKKHDVRQEGDQIKFNAQTATEQKEIDITEFGIELIKSKLRKLDEQKKLTEKHYNLYEKFIEG